MCSGLGLAQGDHVPEFCCIGPRWGLSGGLLRVFLKFLGAIRAIKRDPACKLLQKIRLKKGLKPSLVKG